METDASPQKRSRWVHQVSVSRGGTSGRRTRGLHLLSIPRGGPLGPRSASSKADPFSGSLDCFCATGIEDVSLFFCKIVSYPRESRARCDLGDVRLAGESTDTRGCQIPGPRCQSWSLTGSVLTARGRPTGRGRTACTSSPRAGHTCSQAARSLPTFRRLV